MSIFHIPSSNPEEWRKFLADPENQWKKGHSARTLAYSWIEANGFPPEIERAFSKCDDNQLRNIECMLGFPEHRVPLEGGAPPSQNDLFVLAKAGTDLATITVEGKVTESFNETVDEWLKDASEGKKKRLTYLCSLLNTPINMVNHIQYQLLHRTASAIIEAQRFNAKYAIMLVHSFSQTHKWFENYRDFAALYGCDAEIDKIQFLKDIKGLKLYSGWITGNPKYLTK